ncbi:MAG TPA: cupin domain-containing protein, partial [Pelomicrobium sp.]|nr:cupin domain-containing protein [Pelomicrobium sp.]
MRIALLGGLDLDTFLRRHWQKRPLLVRGALPGFRGLATPAGLRALAARDEVESRIVARRGGRWRVAHGPFPARTWRGAPARDWTLLVQGLDLHLDAAHALLAGFSFIPYARLDDVMVSHAVPGGGVGPHFDSYDVFLLQGSGRRRWRISAQRDLDLVPGVPLKILRRFHPEQEWVLEPGDLLYLPPRYAHEGTAIDECTTYSIGFRAPSHQELASQFLDFLHDRLDLDGLYADPDLAPQRHPARIPPQMVARFAAALEKARWKPRDVAEFAGVFLSEPKPSVVFDPPQRPLSASRFRAAAARRGIALDRRSRLLTAGARAFINGEAV